MSRISLTLHKNTIVNNAVPLRTDLKNWYGIRVCPLLPPSVLRVWMELKKVCAGFYVLPFGHVSHTSHARLANVSTLANLARKTRWTTDAATLLYYVSRQG